MKKTPVESDILSSVVEVENEIQRQLAAEERQWRGWLENARRKLETEAEQEDERLRRELESASAAARKEAEQEAELIGAEAEAWVERISALDDEALLTHILGRLGEIVTERERDR